MTCGVPGCVYAVMVGAADGDKVAVLLTPDAGVIHVVQVDLGRAAHRAGRFLAGAAPVFLEPPLSVAAPTPCFGRSRRTGRDAPICWASIWSRVVGSAPDITPRPC